MDLFIAFFFFNYHSCPAEKWVKPGKKIFLIGFDKQNVLLVCRYSIYLVGTAQQYIHAHLWHSADPFI